MSETWQMPSLDTVYQVEGRGPVTLGELLEGIAPMLMPANEEAFEELLAMCGAWESAEEMDAALTTCEGMREGLRVGEVC